jgi:hypothetical protein
MCHHRISDFINPMILQHKVPREGMMNVQGSGSGSYAGFA